MDGRYASSLSRLSESQGGKESQQPLIDPYKEHANQWFPARDDQGRVYWYNTQTNKTQWNNPYGH